MIDYTLSLEPSACESLFLLTPFMPDLTMLLVSIVGEPTGPPCVLAC